MPPTSNEANPGSTFGTALLVATRLPGVRIDRATYLRQSLARRCSEDQVARAIAESPAAAKIPLEVLDNLADASIRYETSKVTALSTAAGLPGGIALLGTVPADIAQNLAHMLRIAQKLAYLYGWPELFDRDSQGPDDETQNVLTLFIGVMIGVEAANKGLAFVAEKLAMQTVRQLPRRALTQGVVYPIVKAVALRLGVRMNKQVFARGVAKVIPVIGGLFSGGLTLATFLPMARRLKRHLRSFEIASSGG